MVKKRKLGSKSVSPLTPKPEPAPEPEPEPVAAEPEAKSEPEIKSNPVIELDDVELTNAGGGEESVEQEIAGDDNGTNPIEEPNPQFLPYATASDPGPSMPFAASAGEPNPVSASAKSETDAEDEQEPIQKLLEPISKEQLVELLCDAASRHADVMDEVRRVADEDPVHRKIFVHGLAWDTTAETLTSVFRKYGEIEDCKAVRDKISGKSKGYGFILFKHRSAARRAIKDPQKQIGSRMTACQMASAGPAPPPAPPVSEYTQRKIYVSNVSAELNPQKLLQFFSKYGEIEEGPLGLDKVTGKPKGFALFVYKTVESARKALEEPHKNFEGHILHCQKAIDGPKPNKLGLGPQLGVGFHHTAQGPSSIFPGGIGSLPAHLLAPPQAGLGLNQGTQPSATAGAGINPALGQALTALLSTPAAGLGLTNLLGSLGTTGISGQAMSQAVPTPMASSGAHQGAGVSGNMNPGIMGGYGGQASMQGGYGSASIGQGTLARGQQGAGHIGGLSHYMGR